MDDCQFCRIAKHTLDAEIVYESDAAVCFLDHRPLSRGHLVIISKEHFENVFDIDNETLSEVIRIAKAVAIAINSKYRPRGINLLQNNGVHAGQTIFHFHFQVIPRYDEEYLKMMVDVASRRKLVGKEVLGPIASEIRTALHG